MFKHTYSDILIITSGLLILIVAIIIMILKRKEANNYKGAVFFIILGILHLLFATIGNSLVTGYWDANYIKAFLSLISLDGNFFDFFHLLAAMGYLWFVLGVTGLLIVLSNRIRRRFKKHQ
jgi:uncharacterized membrane protein